MVFATGEFLYSNGICRDWHGRTLAEIQHPRRGSWRTLFLTGDDRVRLLRPDGGLVLTTVFAGETAVRDVPVEDSSEKPIGIIRKRGGDFAVEDASGVTIGGIHIDRNNHVMSDLRRQTIALGAEGPDAWRIDMRPGISDTDARLFVAFVMVMDEALHRPGAIG